MDKTLTVLHLWDGRRKTPTRLQFGFVERLRELCNLKVYGQKEYDLNDRELSPIPYNGKMTANDLIKEFNADVFLFPEHAIMRKVAPKELEKINIPTVLMEVDYHGLKDRKDFYKKNNVDLVLKKEFYDLECSTPSVVLPHSADEREFYTDPNSNYLDNRKNIIGFIGNAGKNKYYRIRRKALEILMSAKLLENKGMVGAELYPETLKKYISCLSCAFADLHGVPAKIFEIMASGSALLVQRSKGNKRLFGNKQCSFIFRDDCSNIVEVAKTILTKKELVKKVTKNALEVVNQHHLHKHRIVELYDILKALVSGKKVPRKWED